MWFRSVTECEDAEHAVFEVFLVQLLDLLVDELGAGSETVLSSFDNHEHVVERFHGSEQVGDHVKDLQVPRLTPGVTEARRVDYINTRFVLAHLVHDLVGRYVVDRHGACQTHRLSGSF